MVIRVGVPGRPPFRLGPGEEGFETDAVDPPLTNEEILGAFRPGSYVVERYHAEVEARGLNLVPVTGREPSPNGFARLIWKNALPRHDSRSVPNRIGLADNGRPMTLEGRRRP
jgi:hypothetical protein